jgi:hypothetical protein
VIFTDVFDKALEYGGWPKVLLALRTECLDRTFREVPGTTPIEEVDRLRETFHTLLTSEDGNTLMAVTIPEHSALASAYEIGYARWIPGAAMAALTAVFLLTHSRATSVKSGVSE